MWVRGLGAVLAASNLGHSRFGFRVLGERLTCGRRSTAPLQPGPRQLQGPLPILAQPLPPDHTSAWLSWTPSGNGFSFVKLGSKPKRFLIKTQKNPICVIKPPEVTGLHAGSGQLALPVLSCPPRCDQGMADMSGRVGG